MKKYISLILTTLIALPLTAFDWPQEQTESDMFYSYYGQLRGDQISSSLIFTKSVSTPGKLRNMHLISSLNCGLLTWKP